MTTSLANVRKIPLSSFCDKEDLYVPSFRLAHPTRKSFSNTGRYQVARYFEVPPYRFPRAK